MEAIKAYEMTSCKNNAKERRSGNQISGPWEA